MNKRSALLFVLGVVALSLATVEHVAAKGGATRPPAVAPIAYDIVITPSRLKTEAELKTIFDEEGKKGGHFVWEHETWGGPGTVDKNRSVFVFERSAAGSSGIRY